MNKPTPKFKHFSFPVNYSKQSGAALIMSLVILAAITILGVTNIESSSLEMKMVSAQKERNTRFAVAEAALRRAELELENNATISKVTDLMPDECTGNWCFNEDCSGGTPGGSDIGGLCFQGNYEITDIYRYQCESFDGIDQRFWEDPSIWSDDSKHQDIDINIGDSTSVNAKYIIEFLCFVPDPESGLPFNLTPIGNGNNGEPLFRISVLVEGSGDRSSSVMLQSTYMKKIPL